MSKPLYICTICQSTEIKIISRCVEEAGPVGFYDGNEEYHEHDDINNGWLKIKCEKGHETEQRYIGSCFCGWNSRDRGGNAPEPHREQEMFD